MSEERRKILDMLSDKKINTDEAERLLNALGNAGDGESQSETKGKGSRKSPRYLRVEVTGGAQERVDVRVPIRLIRAGMRWSSFIPSHARETINARLQSKNINFDIGKIKPENVDELIAALSDLSVEVDGGQGREKVRVYCE